MLSSNDRPQTGLDPGGGAERTCPAPQEEGLRESEVLLEGGQGRAEGVAVNGKQMVQASFQLHLPD